MFNLEFSTLGKIDVYWIDYIIIDINKKGK